MHVQVSARNLCGGSVLLNWPACTGPPISKASYPKLPLYLSPVLLKKTLISSKASPLPLLRGGCAYPIFNNMHSRCELRMDEKGGVGGNEGLKYSDLAQLERKLKSTGVQPLRLRSMNCEKSC